MYVTSLASACTELAVHRPTPAGASSEWTVRATQIRCRRQPSDVAGGGGKVSHGGGSIAPPGCLQWFFGAAQGEVKTFNFEGGAHLADQRQSICVRWVSVVYTPYNGVMGLMGFGVFCKGQAASYINHE